MSPILTSLIFKVNITSVSDIFLFKIKFTFSPLSFLSLWIYFSNFNIFCFQKFKMRRKQEREKKRSLVSYKSFCFIASNNLSTQYSFLDLRYANIFSSIITLSQSIITKTFNYRNVSKRAFQYLSDDNSLHCQSNIRTR